MKHFYPLALALIFMLTSFTTKASHIIGGEMHYTCVGSEYYHLYLTCYKDCSNPGAPPFDNPCIIGVFNNSGVLLQTFYLFANPNDISNVPIVNNSPCYTTAQAPNTCMQKAVYDSIVFLPSIPGGYTLTYQRCCRSSTIINLQNPSTTGTTLTCKIPPNSLAPNNSSPSYDVAPYIVVCTGEGLNLDFSATDPDGDVIVYQLANPYLGADFSSPQPNPPTPPPYSSVSWAAGYSAADPVDANPNLSIDAATGILTGTPTGIGTYVICVIAKEYRSGNYLNETRRDYQINFMICNPGTDASMPVNSGLPPVNGNFIFYSSCGNPTVSFTNTSSNANSYAWYFGDGGSSTAFEPTHTYFTTGTFIVTLIANPGYSCVDTFTAAVVIDPPLIADFDFENVCADSSVVFDNQSFCGYGTIQSYAWTFGDAGTSNLVNPTHQYLAPGNYNVTLTITNILGCTDIITQTVTVYPRPTANFTWGNACINSPISFTNTSTVSNIGGSVIDTWYWTFDAGSPSWLQNPTFTFSPSGNHTVILIVTTNHGCKDTVSKTVFVNALPVVTVNPTSVTICAGQSTTLNASGANTYSWLPSGSLNTPTGPTVIATPAVTTTYTVIGTNTSTGCLNSATVTVTVIPAPVITVSPANPQICIWQSITLTASGAGAGGLYSWSPSTGLNTNNGPVVIASPVVTTTYSVTGTDINTGCSATQTVTVTVNPLPNVSVNASINPICIGQSTNLTASGANTYLWSPAGSLNNNIGPTVIATPTITTIYTVIGTNSSTGCQDTANITITVNPLPIVLTNPINDTICIGQSTILNASGADTYFWLPAATLNPSTGPTVTATPTITTIYTVTGTNTSTGCSNTATATVMVNPLPVISVSPSSTAICIWLSTSLTASGAGIGGTYSWSPATGLDITIGATVVANPIVTTTYTVSGTNAITGCIGTQTVTVTVNPLPNISVSASVNPICFGDNSILTAIGANTYTWAPSGSLSSNIGATVTANPTTTTIYTITGTNSSTGCIDTTYFTLTVNQLPIVISTADTSICIGTSGILNVTGAVSYQWYPNQWIINDNTPNPTATPLNQTTYTVFGTDINGCVNTDQTTVSLLPLPSVTAIADTFVCIGDSAMLGATGTGILYQWSPSINISNPSLQYPYAAPIDTTIYTVTTTDVNGCSQTDQMIVNVLSPILNPVFSQDATICFGDSVQLFAFGGTDILWSPATGIDDPTSNSPWFSPMVSTNYTVTVSNFCFSGSDSLSVFVNPLPIADAGPDQDICEGSLIQLNGSGGTIYQWTPSSSLSDPNISNPTSSTTSSINYNLLVTDANGCQATDDMNVNLFFYPVFDLGPDVTICDGDNFQLNAADGDFYSWTPVTYLNNSTIANPVATPADTITYSVSAYDLIGCETIDNITINVQHPFVNNPFPDQIICEGAYVQLIATDGNYYEWLPAQYMVNPFSADPFVNPPVTTTYTVSISNDCFTLYDTITVIVNPLPTIDAGADVTIYRTESAQLNVTGGVEYFWLPSDGLNYNNIPDPVASPYNTITYFITGIDANGCVGSDTITVNVEILNLLVIPTAFTPNGDGVNDVVRVIKMLNIEKILDFKIYNRLGNLVFSSYEMDAAWDGNYNGEPQPIGTYTFYLQAQTLDGELIFKQGNITLIR